MKTAKIISFISFIFNGLFAAYYLVFYLSALSVIQELGAQKPFPWFLFVPPIFAIGSLIYWFYLKDKTKKGEKVNFAWVVSIVLLVTPFIVYFVMAIISDIQVLKAFNQTLSP
jgi:phosphoglycerol transferase MdoB-like AlkP superfamily enzyme